MYMVFTSVIYYMNITSDDGTAPKKFNPFIFLPPAMCDMTATSVQVPKVYRYSVQVQYSGALFRYSVQVQRGAEFIIAVSVCTGVEVGM